MKMKALLDKVKLFVLDMDGTFYLGDRRIDGALDFIHKVKETGRNFIFFTNNSSKNGSMYIEKLAAMDCPITKDQIMTSGDVTAAYLKSKYPGKKVYLVGTPALEAVFREEGICLTEEKPEVVVIGFDMTLTYEKLERACTYIREGAVFLATHKDINCPTETGFIPDCGAICAAITLSTGVLPRYLGKPCRETLDMVLQRTGYNKDEIAFVGDRIYTDVATGVNNGALGILVLSGETKRADIAASEVQPDGVFESLKEMLEYL
ncbi:HAD-IIA family hydrolase [Frisingicoccus sp.]|uniref:HAD-IIA family hydrolase n=1 Tax=Frisingicoccus sp. TaxID=1918627 RepID=UPI003AB4CE16